MTAVPALASALIADVAAVAHSAFATLPADTDSHAHTGGGGGMPLEWLLVGVAALAVGAYLVAAIRSRRRGRPWPLHRAAFWLAGVTAATFSVAGPLAAASHDDFGAHMQTHLLAGMLAPLLLVRAAPVTLALRTLDPVPARRLSRLLRSTAARFVAHPVTAALLSAGGLWLIYLTPVFERMQADPLLHLAVHAHLLAAGYLVTAAFVGLDPRPHAANRMLVAVVLIVTIASHGILAKFLYASPPAGVPLAAAQDGAQLMYYAGAWIEAAVVVLFCARWYRAAGRSLRRPAAVLSSAR